MTAHTPGPWTASPNKWNDAELIVQAGPPTNRVLARFGSEDEPLDSTDHANARLIATAPELLEALKFALRDMEATREQYRVHAPHAGVLAQSIAFARAAIAKATGSAA